MAKYKVLLTDGRMPNYDFERQILSEIDAELVFSGIPYGTRDDEKLAAAAKDADALIVSMAHIGPEVIKKLDRCQVISRYGIGVDTIDIPAATQKGIYVANVVDHCINEVADTALTLVMCMNRKTGLAARQVKQGIWHIGGLRPIHRASVQTLGIIGCGRIGKNLAQKARGIGFNIIGYDPYITQQSVDDIGIKLCSFEEVIETSDIISLHSPLTEETYNMMNADVFAKMKKGACIVNTSRGAVLNEQDLHQALVNGHLGGAGLDATYFEPIEPDNPLLELDQVIITPHTAWFSDESRDELQQKAAKIVADVLTGKPVSTILNPEAANNLNK